MHLHLAHLVVFSDQVNFHFSGRLAGRNGKLFEDTVLPPTPLQLATHLSHVIV